MTDPGGVGVGVRAALHALDAALAEHRRALALAAGRREAQRMAHGREVKAAAHASQAALEQAVERPMRALRLAETWIEVDRARHPLTPGVRAEVAGGELRVRGEDWAGRLVIAPGEGPAAAAAAAAARIAAAVPAAPERARARLRRVVAAGIAHARACHEAAAVLAAADRDAAERHADRARLDACVAELAERLGPLRFGEPPELAAPRARLDQARTHVSTPPAEPFAWLEDWPPGAAGAMLRDVPEELLEAARPAVRRLADQLADAEPLLALGVGAGSVTAVTPERVLVAGEAGTESHPPADSRPGELAERRPGQLLAVLELVVAAGAGAPSPSVPEPAEGDPVELLSRLGELRDRGVLSAAEFEAKKAELLRRI